MIHDGYTCTVDSDLVQINNCLRVFAWGKYKKREKDTRDGVENGQYVVYSLSRKKKKGGVVLLSRRT